MKERDATALLDVIPLPVRLFDSAGVLVRRNALASTDDAAMRGVSLHDYWERDQPRTPADVVVPYEAWAGARALAGETVRSQELQVFRRHLRHSIELSATPVFDDQQHITGVVMVERETGLPLTTHDGAAQELRARDRRLAAIGQLAAGVMHDVNNALNPIMAAAFLLRKHADNPDMVRDYAERIRIAAEMGAATASRVGRFIRQEPLHGHLETIVDLGQLLDEVLELTIPLHRERTPGRGTVRVDRAYSERATVRGNAGELREALLNVVQNATDAMPEGGTLTVRTFIDGSEAGIEIRDSGIGMSAEVRERAFEPFFSTKGAGGTGLGLAEVYGIARRHRGSASIESTPGTGTSVVLRFPLERNEPVPPVEEVTESEPLRVLVVEDHDEGREFLRRLLTGEGHTVTAVSNCTDARAALAKSATAEYDLMITDVGLPDGSGWDLVSHARTSRPTVRVGVITGWEPSGHHSDYRGAEFVLRKPLRAAELLANIARRDASPKLHDD